jgi:hypothetical protein
VLRSLGNNALLRLVLASRVERREECACRDGSLTIRRAVIVVGAWIIITNFWFWAATPSFTTLGAGSQPLLVVFPIPLLNPIVPGVL